MSNYVGPPNAWAEPELSINPELLAKIDRLDRNMEKVMERLCILGEPDPKKLEQHKSLKEAYDKYKFLEKLCGENTQ